MFLKWISRLPFQASLEPWEKSSEIAEAADPNPPTPKPNPPHAMLKRHILPDFCRGGWALDKSFCQFQTRVAQENEKLQVQRLSHSNQKLPTHMHHSRSFVYNSKGNLLFHRFTHSNTLLISKSTGKPFEDLLRTKITRQGKIPWCFTAGRRCLRINAPRRFWLLFSCPILSKKGKL